MSCLKGLQAEAQKASNNSCSSAEIAGTFHSFWVNPIFYKKFNSIEDQNLKFSPSLNVYPPSASQISSKVVRDSQVHPVFRAGPLEGVVCSSGDSPRLGVCGLGNLSKPTGQYKLCSAFGSFHLI